MSGPQLGGRDRGPESQTDLPVAPHIERADMKTQASCGFALCSFHQIYAFAFSESSLESEALQKDEIKCMSEGQAWPWHGDTLRGHPFHQNTERRKPRPLPSLQSPSGQAPSSSTDPRKTWMKDSMGRWTRCSRNQQSGPGYLFCSFFHMSLTVHK